MLPSVACHGTRNNTDTDADLGSAWRCAPDPCHQQMTRVDESVVKSMRIERATPEHVRPLEGHRSRSAPICPSACLSHTVPQSAPSSPARTLLLLARPVHASTHVQSPHLYIQPTAPSHIELHHTYKFVAAESGTVVDRSHALPSTMYTNSAVRPNWKIVEPCFSHAKATSISAIFW